MELKLENGKYCLNAAGNLASVSGAAATAQRLLMRLGARRGSFWPDESYGSDLWTLGKIKPSQRSAAARKFVAEALAGEAGVVVDAVEYIPLDDDSAEVRVELRIDGDAAVLSVRI